MNARKIIPREESTELGRNLLQLWQQRQNKRKGGISVAPRRLNQRNKAGRVILHSSCYLLCDSWVRAVPATSQAVFCSSLWQPLRRHETLRPEFSMLERLHKASGKSILVWNSQLCGRKTQRCTTPLHWREEESCQERSMRNELFPVGDVYILSTLTIMEVTEIKTDIHSGKKQFLTPQTHPEPLCWRPHETANFQIRNSVFAAPGCSGLGFELEAAL